MKAGKCARGVVLARVTAAALGAAAAMIAGPAWGQCMYEVAELADWDCPFGQTVVPLAVNDEGVVVGYHGPCFGDGYYACMWPEPDELLTFDFEGTCVDGRAYDVNSQGTVAGYVDIDGDDVGWIVFKYDGSEFTFLGHPEHASRSRAFAINEKGAVVGCSTAIDWLRATLWRDGVILDLGQDLPGVASEALDLNEREEVVGYFFDYLPGLDGRAFLWADGDVTDLGPIPGGYTSEARAINNRGEITGYGRVETRGGRDSEAHVFRWADGMMTDLNVGTEWVWAKPFDINDLGQIVGYGYYGVKAVGFLWQHGEFHDLNDLVPPHEVKITDTYGINNLGQIVGKRGKAVLLTPIDRPQGDADCDCKVGVTDLIFLLSEWLKTDSLADLNEDGIVDVLDLLIVLGDWSER